MKVGYFQFHYRVVGQCAAGALLISEAGLCKTFDRMAETGGGSVAVNWERLKSIRILRKENTGNNETEICMLIKTPTKATPNAGPPDHALREVRHRGLRVTLARRCRSRVR